MSAGSLAGQTLIRAFSPLFRLSAARLALASARAGETDLK